MDISVENILLPFREYYDITVYDRAVVSEWGNPDGVTVADNKSAEELLAFAESHSVSERYFVSRKANLWTISTHDYAYFFRAYKDKCDFDESLLLQWIELAYNDAISRIKPSTEHLCSFITIIILTDYEQSDIIKKTVRKYKRHKSFLFSLHGWADVRLGLMNISQYELITNKKGKTLNKIFHFIKEQSI